MATQEERHLLTYLDDVDSAVNVTGQHLIEFRKKLFSGQYRKNFLNSKHKFDTDFRYLCGVFANSDNHVIDAIDFARNNNIRSAFIDTIHNLNDNMAESYDKVIAASQDRPLEHRAQISAHVDETINISKKLLESIRELHAELKKRQPIPSANKQNGSSRKRTHRKRTHRKRTHRKRTHRK